MWEQEKNFTCFDYTSISHYFSTSLDLFRIPSPKKIVIWKKRPKYYTKITKKKKKEKNSRLKTVCFCGKSS